MERRWLPVCFLLMQAAWASALVEVASARFGGQGLLLTLPAAAVTLFAGYAAGRRLLARELPAETEPSAAPKNERAARAAPLAMLLLGALWCVGTVWLGRHRGQGAAWLEALPDAVSGAWGAPLADGLALVVTFALWWHGQRTGQAPPEHASTVRAFGSGAIVFAAALLWSAGLAQPPAGLPLAVLLYLGAGLPALSLARLGEVRRDLQANVVRGEPTRLDAAWWRTLAPPMAAVIGAALLAALLLSDAVWRGAILTGLGAAGSGALALLYVPVLLVGYLAEWLIILLRSLRRPPGDQEAPPPPPGDGAELLRQIQRAYEPPAQLESLRWVAVAVAGALALLTFLASSRVVRHAREHGPAGGPDRESLSAWRLLLNDVRAAWRALLSRLRARAAALSAALPGEVGGGAAHATEARDAREAYRALLALGRAHAVPRRPDQTPDEYLGAWRAGLPAADEAAELTVTYTRARYARPAPTGVTASRLRALLRRIQGVLSGTRSGA